MGTVLLFWGLDQRRKEERKGSHESEKNVSEGDDLERFALVVGGVNAVDAVDEKLLDDGLEGLGIAAANGGTALIDLVGMDLGDEL